MAETALTRSELARLCPEIINIRLEHIKIKKNVRGEYTDIDELAQSIRKNGLIQPVTVYPDASGYAIKFGHRRFFAYQKLCTEEPERFQTIPCLVSTSDNIAALQLIENV